MNGVPKVICGNCGKETLRAVHLHICKHCNEDYRGEFRKENLEDSVGNGELYEEVEMVSPINKDGEFAESNNETMGTRRRTFLDAKLFGVEGVKVTDYGNERKAVNSFIQGGETPQNVNAKFGGTLRKSRKEFREAKVSQLKSLDLGNSFSSQGCFFCKKDTEEEGNPLLFDLEFDTLVHANCIRRELNSGDSESEARFMVYLLPEEEQAKYNEASDK